MRCARRTSLNRLLLPVTVLVLATACSPPPASEINGEGKTVASVRAERRAFDGAPPTIPHTSFGMACVSCHNLEGVAVEGVGYAPPSPHDKTLGMSAVSRCQQCHVFAGTDQVSTGNKVANHTVASNTVASRPFVGNTFAGLRQDLRPGRRLHPHAPPTMPHKTLMRENCTACHAGPAAREEIRTSHPERPRCTQCHVSVETRSTFTVPAAISNPASPAPTGG